MFNIGYQVKKVSKKLRKESKTYSLSRGRKILVQLIKRTRGITQTYSTELCSCFHLPCHGVTSDAFHPLTQCEKVGFSSTYYVLVLTLKALSDVTVIFDSTPGKEEGYR